MYNSPEIFQEKISKLFEGFNRVRTCVEDILLITKDDFINHVKELGKSLHKPSEAGLKIKLEELSLG